MHLSRRLRTTAAAAALVLGGSLAAAPAASAEPQLGTRSLASVLLADGDRFDRNWYDYDIVTQAVLAVLAEDPDSPVSVLTRGDVPLTAFLPNDRAFQVLVLDLTGRWLPRERGVFRAVESLGVDTVEQVLLYHVVPGATITFAQALRSDGATLTAAQGGTIRVDVVSRALRLVALGDQDRDDVDPFVVPWRTDLNRGNQQIAHGIAFVLRPADL